MISIIEVKNKVNAENLKQLAKAVKNFYEFYSDFKNYKIISSIVGRVFPKKLQEEATWQGFVILIHKGDYMK